MESLENYDAVYRVVAEYIFRYGRIDYVDSENEYWLELEARLRSDFNIRTGPGLELMADMNRESKMKAAYQRAGIPTARWVLPERWRKRRTLPGRWAIRLSSSRIKESELPALIRFTIMPN